MIGRGPRAPGHPARTRAAIALVLAFAFAALDIVSPAVPATAAATQQAPPPAAGPAAAAAPPASLTAQFAVARQATADAAAACKQGAFSDCLAHLDRAIAARPDHPGLLLQRARALAGAGRSAEAVGVLERVAAMGIAFQPESIPLAPLRAPDEIRIARLRARAQANAAPTGERRVAFTLPGPGDRVPEGIAWDRGTDTFYVGFVHRPAIVRVAADGTTTPFIDGPRHGLRSVLALAVAPSTRRLYVASSALEETHGLAPGDVGRASLLAFDLGSGEPRGAWPLPVDGVARSFGDMTLDADDRPILTDSRTGAIYELREASRGLETLVPAGTLVSPQGVVALPDDRTLIVADYALGLVRVDRQTGGVSRVALPETETALGIDGLVRWGRELVAVQNGVTPQRVMGFRLDATFSRVVESRVLQANLEGFDEPTLGVVRGDDLFYVANSHWNRFDKGRLPPADQLAPPLILRVRLSSGAVPAP